MAAVAEVKTGRGDAWVSAALLVALFVFSWKSVGLTRFNALDTPLFLALGGFCLWHLLRFRLAVPRAMIVPYLLWLGWVLFSDFFSQRFATAFARDAHWLIMPLFALICARLFRADPALVPLLRLAAAGSVLYIAAYLVLFPSRSSNWLIEPVFGHVRHLSMAVGLLTVWLFDEEHPHRAGRALIAAGRFVGLVVLLWAGGRGALIALALALGAYCYLHVPARARLLRYLLEFALAFGASELISLGSARHGLLSGLLRSVTAESVDALSSSRMTIWGNALARLRDGVWLWTGGGGNGYIRLGLAHGFIFHPHNVLLQILTDWGVIGLLALANFLRAALWPLRSLGLSSPGEALAVSILVFLGATGMVDGGLYHLQFLVCAGMAFGILQSRLPEESARTVTLAFIAPGLVALMLAVHLRLF